MEVDSGDVLFDAILASGHTPFDFFITNIIKCNAPYNRPNEADEENMCFNFFVREIKIIRPKVVIALGRQASNAIRRHGKSQKTISIAGGLVLTELEIQYSRHSIKVPHPRISKPFRFLFASVNHPSYAMRQGPDGVTEWHGMFSDLILTISKTLGGIDPHV